MSNHLVLEFGLQCDIRLLLRGEETLQMDPMKKMKLLEEIKEKTKIETWGRSL